MPEYCTCGAQLPSDALFCHKCGKPQRDVVIDEEVAAQPIEQAPTPIGDAPSAPPVARREPPPIDFRNGTAVRIAFFAALLVSFLSRLTILGSLAFLWLMLWLFAAGILAVYLYTRRTGQSLTIRSGARIGWITGTFCFLITMVLFTVAALASSGSIVQEWERQVRAQNVDEASVKQFLEVIQNPANLATLMIVVLLVCFVFFTLVPAAGGAFGAKIMASNER